MTNNLLRKHGSAIFFRAILLLVMGASASKAVASNYYWVGGTGNWSDYSHHWATSSGGSSFQPQVPQSTDNVYFDANSCSTTGQTITIDQTVVNCYNMDWTGATNNPTLTGAYSTNLYIYGSLTLVVGMTCTFQGYVYFQATTTGQTITSASKSLYLVYFEGIGGAWTLQDSLTVQYDLFFDNGTLNTNNFNIHCGNIGSSSTNVRSLNFGSSIITITDGSSGLQFNSTNLSFNAGTSTLIFVYGGYFSCTGLTFYNVIFEYSCRLYDNSCRFNNVTISGGGDLLSSDTFNNLTLNPGTYTLGNQTIIDSLNISGSCNKLLFLQSGSSGSTATIRKSSGSVTGNYLVLQGIAATGGATFTADNSIDGGNNSGWTINALASRNLYWVGNSGNWSDGSHWSTTSGGVGSGCSPTPLDNVFFDMSSFTQAAQTVTVDVGVAYCNNMDWTGALNGPTFSGTNQLLLDIYGSLTLVRSMTYSFAGLLTFLATSPGNTITCAGQVFHRVTYFDGLGGGWTLQDSLSTTDEINLMYGTLNTNNQNVRCYDFASAYSGNVRALNLGSSTITITGSYGWTIYSTGVTLNAGTSNIICTYNSGFAFAGGGLTYYNLISTSPIGTMGIDGNVFNDVVFYGNGGLSGNSNINNLTLSAGKSYTVSASSVQTINDSLNATGTCSAAIYIESGTPGTQGTIKKTSGNVTIDYVYLKDIKATGGATFVANDATDGGNNTGWTINVAGPKNLYWVGGAGNWSDGSHWALTSGGAGSGCIPGPPDNVYFDGNSFSGTGQQVSIDILAAYCSTMDWTGAKYNPFIGAAYAHTLYIYGSLTLIPAMSVAFTGGVIFEAITPGQTITSAGQQFSTMSFNGIGGAWTLQDSLTCTSYFSILHGTINTNNHNISIGVMQTTSYSLNDTFNLGSSKVYITNGNSSWQASYNPIVINAGTSQLIFTDNTGNTNYFEGGGHTYYDVTFVGPTTPAQIEDGIDTFHNLIFHTDAIISQNLSCSSLFLYNPGHTVTVNAGSTVTISAAGQLYALGTAGFPIRIESGTQGSPFTFYKSVGIVCLDYIRLSDSKATGGATFNAGANSQDLGGNTGWSFTGTGQGVTASVSIAASPSTTVCSGTNVTFTATPVNGGNPTYEWLVNNSRVQGDSLSTYSASNLANGDSVTCIMTSTTPCVIQAAVTSNSISLTINSSSVAGTISPADSAICSGSSVSLTDHGSNGTLQWQNATSPGNFANIGGATSSSYSTPALTQTTYYRVIAGTGICADTSVSVQITVNASSAPPVLSASDASICSGDSTSLSVAGSSGALQWQSAVTSGNFSVINGVTGSSYSTPALTQSVYYRIIAGTGACADTSATAEVTVNSLPVPAASTLDSLFCASDSALINCQDSYSSYLWNTGDTTHYTYATVAGDYWLTVTNANGCSAVSNHVNVNVYALPSVSIEVQGDTVASYNSSHYQWLFNGAIIPGATSSVYVAPQSGNYAVQIIDSNGCTAQSSPTYVTVLGITGLTDNHEWTVYPDPFTNTIFITGQNAIHSSAALEIYDVLGRMALQKTMPDIPANATAIDVSALPTGVYALRIEAGGMEYVRKLLKQ